MKESGDPHPGETPSEVLVTGILSEGQANVDSRAGRAGVPETVEDLRAVDRVIGHVAVDKVVDSGGKITSTVLRISQMVEEEKRIIDA